MQSAATAQTKRPQWRACARKLMMRQFARALPHSGQECGWSSPRRSYPQYTHVLFPLSITLRSNRPALQNR